MVVIMLKYERMVLMSRAKTDEEYEIIEESTLEQKQGGRVDYRHIIKAGIYIFTGLCLSQCHSLGQMSPFLSAMLCAMPYDYCSFVLFSGIVGYFISAPWQLALRYTCCAVLTVIFRLILHKRFSHRDGGLVNEIFAPICSLAVSAAYLALTNFSFAALFICIGEAVLCLCATYFFIRFFRTPVFRLGIGRMNTKDTLAFVISLCIFLMCASGFTVEEISPGRILACMVVIFSSVYKGASFGAVTGVCIGASLCLDESYRFLFPAYALGGVVSGMFSQMGQIACTLSFTFSFAVCCILGSGESSMLVSIVEAGVAAACFMIIPARYLTQLQDILEKSGIIPDTQINRYVSDSLGKAAENIYDVASIVNEVSDSLDSVINPEVNRIFASIQQKVCDGCSKKNSCWNKRFDDTASDIMSIAGIESIATNNVRLQKKCPRFPLLTAHINESRADYAQSMAAKVKAGELRRILTDQFVCVGDFLTEISQQISHSRVIDSSRSTALRSALSDTGIYTDALSYFIGENSMATIEITLCDSAFDVDCKKIKTVLELVTKRRFEKAQITAIDESMTVSFKEKMKYRLCTGFAQRALSGKAVCGDSYCTVSDGNGNEAVVLSDGMGTGSRAAIDSKMTVKLMGKLLSSGFSFQGAIKIVNSCLIMRSTDESFATVDALSVNLYSGMADFYKAGAAISFLRRDNSVRLIENPSLPVGIIRNVDVFAGSIRLEAGDIILLVSDGVTADDCGWINDELLAWNHGSMENLASHIVSLARLRNAEGTADDVSAAAVKLLKN